MTGPGELLELTSRGLYCPPGDFHIDPTRPVARAVITHGHADHARAGMSHYWTARDGVPILRKRLGRYLALDGVAYGTTIEFARVKVSFHSAGHILGSSQIRIEHAGQVWVVSGDFKRAADPTCRPFEVVPCDVLVTEATFADPGFHWPPATQEVGRIHAWWQEYRRSGRPAVLFCYALGKAQRILAELRAFTDEPVWLHGSMLDLVQIYRGAGVAMLPTRDAAERSRHAGFGGELILAPPSTMGGKWLRRINDARTAFVSGWMLSADECRRRGVDEGFVISDHADWPALLQTIEDCGAGRVLATHGDTTQLVRHLRERGVEAATLRITEGA